MVEKTKARNRYLSDDHEDFTVSDPDAVVQVLRELTKKDVVLSGVFNSGAEVILTAVLHVDPKQRSIYLDVNANEERNQLLLASKRVIFYSFFGGVKVQWACPEVLPGQFEGRRAFRIEIPEKLQRIQRRNSYRVNTPVTNPVTCWVPIEDREVGLRLVDICVEGIGVILPDPPEPAIVKHAEFKNCRVEHPELGEIRVNMVVQNVWTVDLKNGTQSQRAGLEFVDITPRAEAVVQRFVFKLERLLISTSRKSEL